MGTIRKSTKCFFIASFQDGTYLQKLIQPVTADKGQKRTLEDLLNDFSTPVRKAGKCFLRSMVGKRFCILLEPDF